MRRTANHIDHEQHTRANIRVSNSDRLHRRIHKLFIATKHNNFRPHLLSETGALFAIGLFIGLLSLTSVVKNYALDKSNLLSEVYPAIVASLTNQDREGYQLGTLKYNMMLEAAARKKAQDMIAKSYFAHTSPEGKKPWDWIKEAGYNYEYAGENLAINFSDSIDVHKAWMNSPGHRANILNKNYTEVGIATTKTFVNGKESILVVQMFGQPKPQDTIVLVPDMSDDEFAYVTTVDPYDSEEVLVEEVDVSEPSIESAKSSEPKNIEVAPVKQPETKVLASNIPSKTPINTPKSPENGSETEVLGATDEVSPHENEPVVTEITSYEGTASFISTNIPSEDGSGGSGMARVPYPDGSSNGPDSQKTLSFSGIKQFFYELMTSPRYTVALIYLAFMVILNIAVISFGFVEYRHYHKKSIFIGLLLIIMFSAISLIYLYMTPEMVMLQ